MENKTLCSNNLEVQSNLKELKKLLKSSKFNPEIIELINNSLQILRTMKNKVKGLKTGVEDTGIV